MDLFKPWAALGNTTAPLHTPPKIASAFTQEQLRRLERLHNRPTLYEIEIVRGDGARALLCYGQKNKRQMMDALSRRSESVLAFLGVENVCIDRPRGANSLVLGDAVIRPTGRTQRDAITAGDELPYVGALNPQPKTNPEK